MDFIAALLENQDVNSICQRLGRHYRNECFSGSSGIRVRHFSESGGTEQGNEHIVPRPCDEPYVYDLAVAWHRKDFNVK